MEKYRELSEKILEYYAKKVGYDLTDEQDKEMFEEIIQEQIEIIKEVLGDK